jgi:hypothetical protein
MLPRRLVSTLAVTLCLAACQPAVSPPRPTTSTPAPRAAVSATPPPDDGTCAYLAPTFALLTNPLTLPEGPTGEPNFATACSVCVWVDDGTRSCKRTTYDTAGRPIAEHTEGLPHRLESHWTYLRGEEVIESAQDGVIWNREHTKRDERGRVVDTWVEEADGSSRAGTKRRYDDAGHLVLARGRGKLRGYLHDGVPLGGGASRA